MIEETNNPGCQTTAASASAAGSDPVVAYCQQCGRALTATTQRRTGAAIVCEPCASVRQAQPAGWGPVNASGASGYPVPPVTEAAGSSEPNPVLAGILGLVPGVGAMFNGQYAKGLIHLIIFVVLVSLADNVSWVFWWFVWGWVFYQAFEAYHTAEARRDGQPLPNPFGWNDLGERMGMNRTWPQPARGTVSRSAPSAGTAPQAPIQRPGTTSTFSSETAYTTASTTASTTMAAPFRATTEPMMTEGFVTETHPPFPEATASFTTAPYTPTFTGITEPAGVAAAMPPTMRRFPVGAVWLIGLGILFLLGNILPEWRISARWFVPILLAAVALWMGGRRIVEFGEARRLNPLPGTVALPGSNLVGSLLGPILLLTIAVLLALQDAYVVPLRHSWPALLIVWGGLLLAQQAPTARREEADSSSGSPIPSTTNQRPL